MPEHRIFSTKFSRVYPLYVQKAERKGRTKAEVDQVICWLTGYSLAAFTAPRPASPPARRTSCPPPGS